MLILLSQVLDDSNKTLTTHRELAPEPPDRPLMRPERPKRVKCRPYPTGKECIRSVEWVFGFYLLPERLMELSRRVWPEELANEYEPTLELNGLMLMQRRLHTLDVALDCAVVTERARREMPFIEEAAGEMCSVISIFDLSRDGLADRPLARDVAKFEEHFGHKAVWWELL